jgi:uncharacterized membrane protein
MKIFLRLAPWLILFVSFGILAVFYNSLPSEVLIARSLFGAESVSAQKSLFTVFRVPLIETVCMAMIEVMRRNAVDSKFVSMWTILLCTAAFKSLFQSLEIVSPARSATLFFYFTAGVVALGIIAACFVGREFFSKSARKTLNLNLSEKAFLVFLVLSYFGLAIVPILVYK